MSIIYTVVSTTVAENILSSLWLSATSAERDTITKAGHGLDSDLRSDAHMKGQHSPTQQMPNRRFLDCYPLRCYYDVSEPDRLVRIIRYVLISP